MAGFYISLSFTIRVTIPFILGICVLYRIILQTAIALDHLLRRISFGHGGILIYCCWLFVTNLWWIILSNRSIPLIYHKRSHLCKMLTNTSSFISISIKNFNNRFPSFLWFINEFFLHSFHLQYYIFCS